MVTSIAVLVSAQCLAANMPERFRGVWQAMESERQTCRASDWNSERHSDTHLKVEVGLVRYHESDCRFRSITRPKSELDSGAVRVVMMCEGEGERWSLTEVWQILSIGERDVLSMANASKQRPSISLYRKCGEEEESAGNVQGKVHAGIGEAAAYPTGKVVDMRSTLKAGRHCFAQKDEGAEFSLDVEPSGSVSFSVDVSNPRTKHLCSAGGTATETVRGWRYVDKSDLKEVCQMDIEVSDRIRFRFNNDGCERRYCGARASISFLEFSAQDKKRSCPR